MHVLKSNTALYFAPFLPAVFIVRSTFLFSILDSLMSVLAILETELLILINLQQARISFHCNY